MDTDRQTCRYTHTHVHMFVCTTNIDRNTHTYIHKHTHTHTHTHTHAHVRTYMFVRHGLLTIYTTYKLWYTPNEYIYSTSLFTINHVDHITNIQWMRSLYHFPLVWINLARSTWLHLLWILSTDVGWPAVYRLQASLGHAHALDNIRILLIFPLFSSTEGVVVHVKPSHQYCLWSGIGHANVITMIEIFYVLTHYT